MKNFRYSIVLLLMLVLLQAKAIVQPPVKKMHINDAFISLVTKANSKKENNDQVRLFLFKTTAAKKSGAALLSWEPKLKFRLTHNLNIIFSYN